MTYININALDFDYENAKQPALSFEDWANKNEMYFQVAELEAMDGNLHMGTHRVKMFWGEHKLAIGYGDGILEAFIDLAKNTTGREWFCGQDNSIKAPMKFKGI